MTVAPDIIQVVPHADYTVSVYFVDGKITLCIDIDPETLYALDHVAETENASCTEPHAHFRFA